ncbi:hypothetical protein FRX31_027103 [Thalictrum thalictroides]|uniref:Uncharacterized protein n=1 Tax=Thalictrum thalictroides TaxID=46969 RepID=A0A7J6VDZ2_THATH|nr:hypothetical protein FRX31_027103 [Thalictrum thalictroides]
MTIEHKSFELEGFLKEEEARSISITERVVGRTFKVNTSIGGSRWMGRFLCETSVGDLNLLRYSDSRVSIVGCVQRNRGGVYVEFSCFIKGEKGRKVLCFPGGVDFDGWATAGSAFMRLVDKWESTDRIPFHNPKNFKIEDEEDGVRQLKPKVWPGSAQNERTAMNKEKL